MTALADLITSDLVRPLRPSRCTVLTERSLLRLDVAPLQTAVAEASPHDTVAYAIPLDTPIVSRLATMALLRMRQRRAEYAITQSGGRIVGWFGVDPNLDRPACVFELNTPAAEYAAECLRPRGVAPGFRRTIARWCGCDPALGGLVVIARKP